MKEIKAVIQPQRLSRLRNAFRQMHGFPGMTITRVEGCSGHQEPPSSKDIRDELTEFSPKIRIEIIAPEQKVDEIVALIRNSCHSGRQGDGVVWVTDAPQFVAICRPLEDEPR